MARVIVSGDDDPDIYYVVDSPVGPNCTNRRDDVLLVQFFLRIFADRDKRYHPAGAKDLTISGVYDDLTGTYIKQYADEGNRQQKGLLMVKSDGRVDSPVGSGSQFIPGGSANNWVIIRMNLDYQRWFPKTGLPHFPLFPKELRKNFYV